MMRVVLLAAGLVACGAKPCPNATQARYINELAAACPSALTVLELRACPEYAAIKRQHQAEQMDAGCRVKP